MNGVRQGWLVAKREMRERSRSRAFLISLALMMVAVVAVLVLPALMKPAGTKDVGLTGATPPTLAVAISQQARATGFQAEIRGYGSVPAAEQDLRQGRLDVLVVGARRLEWTGQADQELKAVVTAAIQQVMVRERAAAAGIRPEALASLLAPVPVTNVELGPVAGRSAGDETAVFVMTLLLFSCISVFGSMVMTGVLEEKANRVVEVLLARMPARTLLAGKIAGIGLLGLAQVGATALVALVAATSVSSIHIPAIRAGVLAWAVVWFVLGYLLYATVYGALGSLGSRVEDAQSLAGPTTVVLVVGYFAAFAMINQPASALARAVSFFPLTAPMAMPGRIAMGATAWWEPVVAALLTIGMIAALVWLAGRVYTGAILHGGPALGLREAWRRRTSAEMQAQPFRARPSGGRTAMSRTDLASHRLLVTVLTGIGVVLGVVIAVFTSDVILGVIAGAGFIAISVQMVNLWTRHSGPPVAHR